MQSHLAELFGVAAAAASLYAAQSKTIIPLRAAVMAANCLAMIYSFLHGTYPTFVLNAVLLPVNAWRRQVTGQSRAGVPLPRPERAPRRSAAAGRARPSASAQRGRPGWPRH